MGKNTIDGHFDPMVRVEDDDVEVDEENGIHVNLSFCCKCSSWVGCKTETSITPNSKGVLESKRCMPVLSTVIFELHLMVAEK